MKKMLLSGAAFAVAFFVSCSNDDSYLENDIDLIKTKEIVDIEEISDLVLDYGEHHNLPFMLEVELSDGVKSKLPIEWDGGFNSMKAGEYKLIGRLFTKHDTLIKYNESISVNVIVSESNTKPTIISEIPKKSCLGAASPNRILNGGRIRAIDTTNLVINRTLIDKYEVFFRIIETEEERRNYEENTLFVKKYDWQQQKFLIPKTTVSEYDLTQPLVLYGDREYDYTIHMGIVYKYAKYEFLDKGIKLNDEAKELFNKSPEEFKSVYGEKYISSITLGSHWRTNLSYGFNSEKYIETLDAQKNILGTINYLVGDSLDYNISTEYAENLFTVSISQNLETFEQLGSKTGKILEQLQKMKEFTEGNKERDILEYEELYPEYKELPVE